MTVGELHAIILIKIRSILEAKYTSTKNNRTPGPRNRHKEKLKGEDLSLSLLESSSREED
jgi:hypothetical protein